MELTDQQKEKLSELEACFRQYFRSEIRPVMESVGKELDAKRYEEEADFLKSTAVSIALASNPHPGVGSMQADAMMRATGEWSRKTAEDYLEMCRDRLGRSATLSGDLSSLADAWRSQVIDVIGRERYDTKSKALGEDLAMAYVSYRMDDQMVQYLIDQRTPRSAMEYIVRKGMDDSLLGLLTYKIHESPLEAHISESAEAAYPATVMEKGAGKLMSIGLDALSTAGFGSWAGLGGLAVTEIGFESGAAIYDHLRPKGKVATIEEIISTEVLGVEPGALAACRQESRGIIADRTGIAQQLDERMDGRMGILSRGDADRVFPDDDNPYSLELIQGIMKNDNGRGGDPNVIIPYAPGYDPGQEEQPVSEVSSEGEEHENEAAGTAASGQQEGTVVLDEEVASVPRQGTDGWGSLAATFGLNGMGATGRNLGYVVSMLPDVLYGMFTGNSRNLGLKDNVLPIASILVGLFVRNPLLKMMLIGTGGLNLFNKAGKDVLGGHDASEESFRGEARYRKYPDEALNDRLKDPEVKGNALFATVDGVPCTVQLPLHTVAAYQSGALPLNTLANAVLAKSDEMNRIARENYERTEGREDGLSRGI